MVPVSLGSADVLVVAGGGRFAAHAALLAAHSGYFRAAIAERDPAGRSNVLYVPNISAQQFWPLLAYMYTGYLDLTPDNIYQVLLATHLLHMQRPLELCRNFLSSGRAATASATSTPPTHPPIVKPIPSRKLPPYLPPIFRPVYTENPIQIPFSADAAFQRRPVEEPPKPPSPIPEREIPSPAASTSGRISVGNDAAKRPVPSTSKTEETKPTRPPSDDKIVVDIACCDGPVRFHRVLNDAYKSGDKTDVAELTDSDDSYVEIEEDTRSRGEVPFDGRGDFNKSLQKQMNENIRMNRENLEESGPTEEEGESRRQDALFTCVYCNHTFKSQYCYQKHARRHLNPVSIDAVSSEAQDPISLRKKKALTLTATATAMAKSPSGSGPKREVRLLDMNVQYYPCKTCGSKFPSYYFVHKHRKLCHAEEMEGSSESAKSVSSNDKKRKSTVKDASEYNSNKPADVS